MELTINQLRAIMPNAKLQNLKYFLDDFNAYAWLHKITDFREASAFISQVAKETNELLWWKELADGSEYEGRLDLGNRNPGDGVLFKGRGYFQLTGRFNYAMFTIWYNKHFADKENFIDEPDRISEEHQLSMLVSIFFWTTRGLNNPEIYTNCRKTTEKINGGYNGYNDRLIYLNRALKVLAA